MQHTSTEYRDTYAVLADLAAALQDADRRSGVLDDPATAVEGFQQLPAELQEVVKEMSAEELAAVGRMHGVLVANGYFVQNGDAGEDAVRRLSMF